MLSSPRAEWKTAHSPKDKRRRRPTRPRIFHRCPNRRRLSHHWHDIRSLSCTWRPRYPGALLMDAMGRVAGSPCKGDVCAGSLTTMRPGRCPLHQQGSRLTPCSQHTTSSSRILTTAISPRRFGLTSIPVARLGHERGNSCAGPSAAASEREGHARGRLRLLLRTPRTSSSASSRPSRAPSAPRGPRTRRRRWACSRSPRAKRLRKSSRAAWA